MITKLELDKLAEKYDKKLFIKDDPIQFVYRFTKPEEQELAGFISALFAYGSRKVFIQKLYDLFSIMDYKPIDYIKRGKFSNLNGFNYRFAKEYDVIKILKILNKLYQSESIKSLFRYGYESTNTISGMLQIVADYFYSNVDEITQGFAFMLANPKNGGAMKRMNMYLRWMVRNSDVDLGLWDFIPKSELLIPLDTHVAKISRQMGLITRKSNDMRTVIELSNKLKEFDNADPTKYDFAIYGLGINK